MIVTVMNMDKKEITEEDIKKLIELRKELLEERKQLRKENRQLLRELKKQKRGNKIGKKK